MNNEKEISFGAFDSELMHQEIFIPEGFEATIDGNKIILKKKESKDERIRKELIGYFTGWSDKHLFRGFKAEQILTWLEKQGKETSWKPSKEEMDVLYGLAYITNQYNEHKEEVITRLYQDLKREFFNGSSYENMFPTYTSTEDDVRRRSTIQVLEYARSLDVYNQFGKADIDKNIAWLEKQGDKDKLIQELGEYKVKYTQEVLEKHINSMSNKDNERLRNTTIAFLKDFADKGYENAVECIDWLEKQGEHKKFRDSIQVGDEVTRNRDGVIVNLSKLNRVAKKDEKQSETFTKRDVDNAFVEGMAFAKNELEKQSEQKPIMNVPSREVILSIWDLGNEWKELTKGSISIEYGTQLNYIQKHWHESEYYLREKQGEQKLPIEKLPSEMKTIGESLGFTTEDEEYINYLIEVFDGQQYHQAHSDEELVNWLKSLKQRYFWKPNGKNEKLTDVNHEYFSELLESDDSKDINDYAYQVAYCMSHDWAIENPTWDNVQSACRLGAKWQKKHDVSEDWSEEDEKMIGRVRGIIEAYAFSQSAVDVNGDLCEKKFIDVDIWLKSIKDRVYPKHEWKQENTDDLTDFENAMMHIGESFFGKNAGLDPNDIDAIKEQANTLLGLVPSKEWSEEDEKIRQTIINEFEQCSEWCCSNGLTKEDCINWLNRQKYFDWSDEDNENINSLCVLLDQMVSINAIGNEHSIEYKNWLKSLKDRYIWKPSNEQMHAFEQVYDWYNNNFAPSETLTSLYDDLKKLKGE
jgi:hypothetical protein